MHKGESYNYKLKAYNGETTSKSLRALQGAGKDIWKVKVKVKPERPILIYIYYNLKIIIYRNIFFQIIKSNN